MALSKTRISLLAYVVVLHIVCAGLVLLPDQVRTLKARLGWHDTKPSQFYTLSIPPQLRQETQIPEDTVLLFGDSIVEGWWRDDYPWPVVNYGIGGDTSHGLRRRVSEYQRLDQAGLIVISVGVNDLGRRGVDEVMGYYGELFNKLPADVPVLVLSVSPVDERLGYFQGYNANIVRLNQRLEVFVQGCGRCNWLDMSGSLRDQTGNLATEYHSGDGLHLSAKGYEVWGQQVVHGISRVLEES